MPGYVQKVLHKYQHTAPSKPEYSPHQYVEPAYGQKIQLAPFDDSPLLDNKGTKRIQGIIGSLLYYGRAIDNTILKAINKISAVQAKPTEKKPSSRHQVTRLRSHIS